LGLSTDPDDLSLKLRKMFPKIEEQKGDHMPSSADFSEIMQLQEFRKLYEEQEDKVKIALGEKSDELARLRTALGERDEQLRAMRERMQQGASDLEKHRNDYQRLKQEAQEKIDKLMERIKELNQRLMARA
jgi:chromosome segregation ATPase